MESPTGTNISHPTTVPKIRLYIRNKKRENLILSGQITGQTSSDIFVSSMTQITLISTFISVDIFYSDLPPTKIHGVPKLVGIDLRAVSI